MKKLAIFLIILAISCATVTQKPEKPTENKYIEFRLVHAECPNCDEID